MVPTLLGVVTLTFIVTQFVPGGPVEQVMTQLRHGAGRGGDAGAGGGGYHGSQVSIRSRSSRSRSSSASTSRRSSAMC